MEKPSYEELEEHLRRTVQDMEMLQVTFFHRQDQIAQLEKDLLNSNQDRVKAEQDVQALICKVYF